MSAVGLVGRLGGAFALADDPGTHLGRPLTLTVSARIDSLGRLLRERAIALVGEIDATGLAEHRPLSGEVCLEAPSALSYELTFNDDSGRPCRFRGRQRLSLRGSPVALTVIDGCLETTAGQEIGRARVRVDLRRELWRCCSRATMMGDRTTGAT
jgi:hypothetical protein